MSGSDFTRSRDKRWEDRAPTRGVRHRQSHPSIPMLQKGRGGSHCPPPEFGRGADQPQQPGQRNGGGSPAVPGIFRVLRLVLRLNPRSNARPELA